MKYELIVQRNFHFRRNEFLTPETYRVPEEVSEEIAQQCIKAGAGRRMERMKLKGAGAAPENKATAPDEVKKKALTGPEQSPSSRPRGRPRKDQT